MNRQRTQSCCYLFLSRNCSLRFLLWVLVHVCVTTLRMYVFPSWRPEHTYRCSKTRTLHEVLSLITIEWPWFPLNCWFWSEQLVCGLLPAFSAATVAASLISHKNGRTSSLHHIKGLPSLYHVSNRGQEETKKKQEKEMILPLGMLPAPVCLQLRDLCCLLNHLWSLLILLFRIVFCHQPYSWVFSPPTDFLIVPKHASCAYTAFCI